MLYCGGSVLSDGNLALKVLRKTPSNVRAKPKMNVDESKSLKEVLSLGYVQNPFFVYGSPIHYCTVQEFSNYILRLPIG